MKELWARLHVFWLDAVLAVAALVSLQVNAADPYAGVWPFAPFGLRLVLMVVPLLIAVRRYIPVPAVIGLSFGAYVASLVGQPPWLLYGGAVLALWSAAGRCRALVTLAAGAVAAGGPYLVDREHPDLVHWLYPQYYTSADRSGPHPLATDSHGMWQDDWYNMFFAHFPWRASLALGVVTVVFVVIRRRAVAVPARERWAALWAFLRGERDVRSRDVLLAIGVAGLILTEVGQDIFKGGWWSAPGWMPYGVAAAGLVLALRQRPVIQVGVLAAASLIANWQSFHWIISLYAAFGLALYWLVVTPKDRRSLRRTVPIAVGVMALMAVITREMRVKYLQVIFPDIRRNGWDAEINGVIHNTTYDGIAKHVWPITLAVVLGLVPVLVALVVRRSQEGDRRAAELEQEAEEREAEQVVLTERAMIARDLHDVVAHAVNLMVIQAETGPDLVRRGESDVLAGFQRIGDAGRRALSELDRLLSALRDEDGVPDPQLAPQPGLSELPQLVADVTSEQLPIELSVDGQLDELPEGQQVTAYRIVQEALTNVVKHAKASGVQVSVRSEETGMRVEVTDDGVGFDVAAARRGNRHGLAGMRERVRIEGGTLDIRSTPGAGTTVDAWMPR